MKYFRINRLYDSYRLLRVDQYPHHCEIVLQGKEYQFDEKHMKGAIKCATMIAKALGIVELQKISEPHYHKTGKKVIVFDENNYVSEEDEILVYYVFYFKRRIRHKRKPKRG